MQTTENLNRVAIVGCGHIGASSVYSLLQSGTVKELVLAGCDSSRLFSEIIDLHRTMKLNNELLIWTGDYRDAARADIVIVVAGKTGKHPDETRLDSIKLIAEQIRNIMRELKARNFSGIALIATNPADIMTQIAQEESGLPAGKVIGTGTIFNSEQFRTILQDKSGVKECPVVEKNARDYSGFETATWCAARSGASPLVDFCNPDCPDFGYMLDSVRAAAAVMPSQIIGRKAAYTSLSVGTCANKICEAILQNEREVLPVSAKACRQYGVSGVYLNLPCVIGKNGVEQIIEMPISETEKAELKFSARLIKEILNKLKGEAALAA